MVLRAELLETPPIFPEANPMELMPYHETYNKYVKKRIEAIQESLRVQNQAEELYNIALEYIQLEQELAKRSSINPSLQMQFEVLHAIIFESGYFVPLDEIREIHRNSLR